MAKDEGLSIEEVATNVASGTAVIPVHRNRKANVVGIGMGMRTKVNASIGASSDKADMEYEVEKAKTAESSGADTLMELSVAGNLTKIRREVLASIALPVGSVPVYQAMVESIEKLGAMVKMVPDYLFDVIEQQAKDGIGFMAIHSSINTIVLDRLIKQGYRTGGLVSRGGAFLVSWMRHTGKENPLYSDFDRLVEILKRYDVVLSLGNGMRAGAVDDSTDRAQIQELIINSELADYARERGVQVIIEGPGHIPIDEIETNVKLQKKLSKNAPFYMLGPITTDIAPGYDHITSAIGAAISSAAGADFICYVTPSEHLALPTVEDVKEGVIVARIAAHTGDMVKLPKVRKRDKKMSVARKNLDWQAQFSLALTSEKAKEIRGKNRPKDEATCSMCGELCALKITNELFE